MAYITSVRFRQTGRTYLFDTDGQDIKKGMHVLVETVHGIEYGEAVSSAHEVADNAVTQPLKPIIRIATPLSHIWCICL